MALFRRGQRKAGPEAGRTVTAAAKAAAAALRWPLNLWLEGGLWFCLGVSLGVSYVVSYTSLAAVAGAIGYGAWERWVVPLAVDVPLAASVLGQLLAARWRSPWWVKVLLGLLSFATAPATLAGNALNGAVVNGAFDFARVDVLHLVAFGLPGGAVVLVALVTSIMLGQRASLHDVAGTERKVERKPDPEPPKAERKPPPPPTVERKPTLPPIGAAGQLAAAIAAVRKARAEGRKPTGRLVGDALGVSEVRGRHWRDEALKELGEAPFRPSRGVAA